MTDDLNARPGIDPELLAAYVDNRLPPDQRAEVEARLAADPESYELLVEVMETQEALGQEARVPGVRTVPFVPRARTTPRWVLAGSVLAAAAALVLVVWLQPELLRRLRGGDTADPRFEKLVAAVGEERYIEARLTGGFKYGPLRPVTRGNSQAQQNLALVATAGTLQIDAKSDPAALHPLAVSLVLLGRIDEGIEALEKITAATPTAAALTDLAAAYLSRSSPVEHPDDVPKALAAAERATEMDSTLPEACFNLAISLERLNLRDQTAEAWTKCASLDNGPWRAEAERRLAALRTPAQGGLLQQQRRGAEDLIAGWARAIAGRNQKEAERLSAELALLASAPTPSPALRSLGDEVRSNLWKSDSGRDRLARAYLLLAEGKSLYRRYLFAQALPPLREASQRLLQEGSSFRLDADANLGIVYHHLRKVDLAEPLLRRTAADATAAGYFDVAAQAYMGLGILVGGQGRYGEALECYRRAGEASHQIGDELTERYTSNLKAEVLHLIGDYTKAWREVNIALPVLSDHSDFRRRLSVLFVASTVSMKSGLARAARRLQTSFVATANAANVPVSAVEGLISRARASSSLGDLDAARQDLEDASSLVARHEDLSHNRFLNGEMRAVLSELIASAQPQPALAEVDKAIDYMIQARRREKLPKLYLLQGRLNLVLGRTDAARTSLSNGYAALLQHVASVGPSGLSFTRVESAWDLMSEWLDFQVSVDHRPQDALASLEGLWQSMWHTGSRANFSTVQQQLAPRVSFLYYVPTSRAVLVWIVRRDGTTFHEIAKSAMALEADLLGIDEELADDRRLALLGRELLSPAADALRQSDVMVICPVGIASRVPWSVLTAPWSDRPLVREVALALSPGLGVTYAMTRRKSTSAVSTADILLIGGSPSSSVAESLGVALLPGAEDELRQLHERVKGSTLIDAAEATPARFMALAPRFGVIHFAGHALYREAAPDESSLVLAGSDAVTSSLTAREIAGADFSRANVVILAACETIGGQSGGTEGPLGLGKAFLVAGARLVVGTRWPVPDSQSLPLMLNLHRYAAESGDYVVALRKATVECLDSAQPCAGRSTWAAYVAVGSSSEWFVD